MAEKLLSDKQLRTVKPREKEFLLADGGSLFARVRRTASGEASIAWQFFFKWEGRTERVSIGPFPAVTLKEARQRRDAAREELAADPPRHPAMEARKREEGAKAAAQASRTARTVRDLFDNWHTTYLATARKDGGAEAKAFMEHDVFPFIGDRPAKAVGREDIAFILDRMVARGVRRKANSVLALLKQMFAHGVIRGYVDVDPCYGYTKKHAGGKEHSRERVLSAEELRDLAARLPKAGLSHPIQAAVRFLLATGVRVGEFNLARWEHIDAPGALWIIPKEHSKNGREHRVHLSAFALRELGTLGLYRENDWLLSSRTGEGPIDDKAIAKAMRDRQREEPLAGRTTKAAGTLRLSGGDWTPHDLRRTFATRLGDLGVAPHVVERCLNHTMQGVMAVYNRNDYWNERREALDLWGAELERLFAPTSDNLLESIPTLKGRRRTRRAKRP